MSASQESTDQVPPPLSTASTSRMSAAPSYSTYFSEEDAAGIRQAAKRRSTVDPTSNPMQPSISSNSLSGNRPSRESVHAMHEATTFKDAMHVLGEDVVRFAKTGNFKDYLRICYHLYCWTIFWLLVTLCVLMEPFLCSWRKPRQMFMQDANWIGQIFILGLSSFLLIIQVYAGVYLKRKETDGLVERIRRARADKSMGQEEERRLRKLHGWESIDARNKRLEEIEDQHARDSARAEMEKEYALGGELWEVVMEGAIILETTTLLGGWFFIFYRPGLASLRCFRLLRVLYFHQLPREIIYRLEGMWYQRLNPLSFVEFHLMEKAFRFASQSLTSLGREMFFLTAATRGGLLLMCLLGFFAFVVGMAVYQEIYNEVWLSSAQTSCKSVGLCTLVMLRLTFFDGTGLDLFTMLSMDHKFLFCIVILYLCTSSFGIVNGLIGLFGSIFSHESLSAFRTISSSSSSSFSSSSSSRGAPSCSSTPLLGYSEKARQARGENVRVPGPGRLFKGDVVMYRSTFVANEAKKLDLRKLGMTTDVRPLEGDFYGLVGVVTDVHLHHDEKDARHNVDSRSEGRKRGAISQINISQFAAARRGTVLVPSPKVKSLTRSASSRQDLEKGLQGLREQAEYGMTYSVHFEGREQVERFRVEFFPTPLNPQPHSTLLHLLLTRRRASGAEDFNDDGDFQPLAGVLELLPVASSVEERLCKLLEQHSEADRRQHGSVQGQGQGRGLEQEAPRAAERLDLLEASVRDLHSKMDRLMNMLSR